MPRVDRKRLVVSLIKESNPRLNKKQLKAILRSMITPKVFSQLQIRKALFGELTGAISSAFSTSVSAADGVINHLAIAIVSDSRSD